MSLELKFFPHFWLIPIIIFAIQGGKLFTSKAPNNVTPPLSQNRVYLSQTRANPCHLATYLCFSQVCSQTLCIKRPPLPCLLLKNISSSLPAFLYLGSGKETIMKMTELPGRMMTSLLKKYVNSPRRQQGRETRRRAEIKRNLPLGFPHLLSFVKDGLTGLSELMFAL